jgi:hypothetical protein
MYFALARSEAICLTFHFFRLFVDKVLHRIALVGRSFLKFVSSITTVFVLCFEFVLWSWHNISPVVFAFLLLGEKTFPNSPVLVFDDECTLLGVSFLFVLKASTS